MAETRLKIAVFIDFDNIEIGVQNTLNATFNVGVRLEALRERGADRGGRGQSGPVGSAGLDSIVPLVRRALKLLSDREVTPQLGLLKSTLLQLDSTFSERTYGAGSFRDFAEKLAATGVVTLRESGRNVLVELSEGVAARADDTVSRQAPARDPVDGDAPPAP